MRQEITFLRAVPAQVVGFLSRDSVHVILYPGTRADEPIRGIDGQFYQSKTPIPREVWPDELLRPNAEVWLIYERQSVAVAEEGEVIEVCPRVDRHPPEKWRAALAQAAEAEANELAAQRRADVERQQAESSRRRWWQLWRQ